jgi:hypothetical protein
MSLVPRLLQTPLSAALLTLFDPAMFRTTSLVRANQRRPQMLLSVLGGNHDAHYGRLPSIFFAGKSSSCRPDVAQLRSSALCSAAAQQQHRTAAPGVVLGCKQHAMF